MNKQENIVVCPKCNSWRLTVYFMNWISWANDYSCRDCKHKFRYSRAKLKYYNLPRERKIILDRFDED